MRLLLAHCREEDGFAVYEDGWDDGRVREAAERAAGEGDIQPPAIGTLRRRVIGKFKTDVVEEEEEKPPHPNVAKALRADLTSLVNSFNVHIAWHNKTMLAGKMEKLDARVKKLEEATEAKDREV